MSQQELKLKDFRLIRRFEAVHARTMQGACSAVFKESDDGDFVTYADYVERINALLAESALARSHGRLVEVVKEIRELAERQYKVSIGNQWAWVNVQEKCDAALARAAALEGKA